MDSSQQLVQLIKLRGKNYLSLEMIYLEASIVSYYVKQKVCNNYSKSKSLVLPILEYSYSLVDIFLSILVRT